MHRVLRRVDSAPGPRIVLEGRSLLNFAANDYLGLAGDAALREAAIRAVEKYGAGSGASRLICGSLAPHHELEEALASFKRVEAALTFSSGYAAAVGTLCAVLEKDDIVILDKLVHASIVDGARLSGAKLRVFDHNDLSDLERILRWADQTRGKRAPGTSAGVNPPGRRVLVVTESIFSMDGDAAPLREIVELKDRYGAWLMLDEAHATGILGPNRLGLAEACGAGDRVEIQMGTLGKAFGASGGYIAGSRVLIEFLINRARSFIFSTAPVPAAAGAALAGVEIVRSQRGEELCARLWERIEQFANGSEQPTGTRRITPAGAIHPIILGAEEVALTFAESLRDRGIYAPAIRYPTVARGQARLRISLSAAHSQADVEVLIAALDELAHTHAPARET